MLCIVGKHIFQKIIISTLATTLLMFPVLVRSNPVFAENEIQLSPEQIQESFGENIDEFEENLLLTALYMAKYQQTGNIEHLDRVIESIQEIVRLQPNFVPARTMLYLCLGEKAVQQKEETLLMEIERHYQALIDSSLEPEDLKEIPPPAHFTGALYYNISSEPMTEEEELKYEQKAIEALQQAISVNPDFYGSHLLLGKIYYVQDKNDLALSEVQEAIRLEENDPNNYDLLGSIYIAKIHPVENCWDNEAITEGIRAYKRAISLAPNHVIAHLGLTKLYIHQGAYNLAVVEGRIAVELFDDPFTHKQLGEALLYAQDYEQAISEYQEALKQDQDNSYAILHAEIAFAHFLLDNFEDSVQEYQKYIGLTKTEDIYSYVMMHYHLALRQLGKHEEAHKLLENYLANFDGEEWELALLQFNVGKLSETELLNQADNKCKQNEALFFAGYQYLLKGEPEKAQRYFQKALDTKVYCNYEYLVAAARLNQLKLK